MRYAKKDKTAVTVESPEDGGVWVVPRGNRLWFKWGVQEAEEKGEILPAPEEEE